MTDYSQPWVRLSNLHQVIDCPGQLLRRAARRSGVEVLKDDAGYLRIQKPSFRLVAAEAVRLGAKYREKPRWK